MTDQPNANAVDLWHSILHQHRKIVNLNTVDAWRSAVMDAQSAFAAALPRRLDLPENFARLTDSQKVDCFAEITDNQRLRTAMRIRNRHCAHRDPGVLISDPDGATALTREEALSVVVGFEEALVLLYGFPYPEPPTSADVELMRKVQQILTEELRREKEDAVAKLRAAQEETCDLKATVKAVARLRTSAEEATNRRQLRQYARAAGISLEAVQRGLPSKTIDDLTCMDIDNAARGVSGGGTIPRRRQQIAQNEVARENPGLWEWATKGAPGKLAPRTVNAFRWMLILTATAAVVTYWVFRVLSLK